MIVKFTLFWTQRGIFLRLHRFLSPPRSIFRFGGREGWLRSFTVSKPAISDWRRIEDARQSHQAMFGGGDKRFLKLFFVFFDFGKLFFPLFFQLFFDVWKVEGCFFPVFFAFFPTIFQFLLDFFWKLPHIRLISPWVQNFCQFLSIFVLFFLINILPTRVPTARLLSSLGRSGACPRQPQRTGQSEQGRVSLQQCRSVALDTVRMWCKRCPGFSWVAWDPRNKGGI